MRAESALGKLAARREARHWFVKTGKPVALPYTEYANFSEIAYQKPGRRPATHAGFRYMAHLSNDSVSVYRRNIPGTTEGTLVVAFRGTSTAPEWADNVSVWAGDTASTDAAIAMYEAAVAAFPSHAASVTGHSRGGYFAAMVHAKHGTPGHLFNPLGSFADVAVHPERLTVHVNERDPVAQLKPVHTLGDVVYYPAFPSTGIGILDAYRNHALKQWATWRQTEHATSD